MEVPTNEHAFRYRFTHNDYYPDNLGLVPSISIRRNLGRRSWFNVCIIMGGIMLQSKREPMPYGKAIKKKPLRQSGDSLWDKFNENMWNCRKSGEE